MSQIKDTARGLFSGRSGTLRPVGAGAIDGQISGLLARRARLAKELVEIDRKLVELQSAAGRKATGDPADPAPRWFPIRGEQLLAGAFAPPEGLDRDDLNRRLGKVLLDEQREGRPVDGLEILVGFLPPKGRVLSVRTRRPGEADWAQRFEAFGKGRSGH